MKLIAFDWDQTLWHSWTVHVMAAQHAAKTLDIPVPNEGRIASNFSVPFVQHMKLVFPEHTVEATKHYMDFYHSNVGDLAYLFEGVHETIELLKSRGFLIALLSDKRHNYESRELETTSVANLFDCVLFLDGQRAYKPNPEGLVQVMDDLAVAREEVLYVGNSHVDVRCAKNAGTKGGAALWGSVDVEAVLTQKPDYAWRKIEEIVTTLV